MEIGLVGGGGLSEWYGGGTPLMAGEGLQRTRCGLLVVCRAVFSNPARTRSNRTIRVGRRIAAVRASQGFVPGSKGRVNQIVVLTVDASNMSDRALLPNGRE